MTPYRFRDIDWLWDPWDLALSSREQVLERSSILRQSIGGIFARHVRYDEGIMETQVSTC